MGKVQSKSLREAIKEDDDWSGMDSAARRKRQNRLNQRAYRRREAQKEQNVQQQSINVSNTREYQPHITPNNPSTQISELSVVPAHSRPDGSLTRPPLIPYFSPTSPFLIPGPITFPLTADHLITLIQYNVLRAIFTNIWILSLGENLPTECGNVLALPKFAVPSTIPPSFEPTPLQKCTPHDFWIDTVPLGRARDNFILMTGSYDHDDLCSDMVGGLYEGYNDLENKGMLVWSDPWCVGGWELTEGFLKKWGWLLRGCGEFIESTNRWRGLRGEEPLVFEL